MWGKSSEITSRAHNICHVTVTKQMTLDQSLQGGVIQGMCMALFRALKVFFFHFTPYIQADTCTIKRPIFPAFNYTSAKSQILVRVSITH